MRFKILGPMEVTHAGRVCTPTATKVRWTLAFLLLRANRIVDTASLIDELWGDHPPRSALTTMQTYIYQLRKIFSQVAARDDRAVPRILTRSPGYTLQIDDEALDARVFERLLNQGRDLLDSGNPEEASRTLRSALDLWCGPALADIPAGRLLEAHVTHFDELRIKALGLRIRADRQLGRAAELLPELRSLVSSHPLNEWFHGELIKALTATGRRGEALQAYQALRRILHDELGLEPSPAMRRLHQQLLTGDSPPIPVIPSQERRSPASVR